MTLDYDLEEHIQKSDICRFYEGKNIIITGATGYIGKFVLEKLLRTCTSVGKVYILVRNKKDVDFKTRVIQLLDCPLFTRFYKEFEKKVVPIQCDIDSEDLGLSDFDKNLLQQNVNIVFHIASNIKFNQPLNSALKTNVLGSKRLMDFCGTFKDLQAIVHMSTLYSFIQHDDKLQEEFYHSNYNLEDIMTFLKIDDETVQIFQPKIIDHWKSPFFFTKAITEDILNDYYRHLPLAIFRPGIVHAPTSDHPVVGYLDNLQESYTASSAYCNLGMIRTLYTKKGSTAHIVPVDYVVNAMLTIPVDICQNRCIVPKIYHFATANDNCKDWPTILKQCVKNGQEFGFENAVWYPSVELTENENHYKILKFFLHFLPALIVYFVFTIFGRKNRIMADYRKIDTLLNISHFFTIPSIQFSIDNISSL